jgi:superfamily II DNA or RNA helicase
MKTKVVHLPALVAAAGRFCNSPIIQIHYPADGFECTAEPFSQGRVNGEMLTLNDGRKVLLVPRHSAAKGLPDTIVVCPDGNALASEEDGRKAKWALPKCHSMKDETRSDGVHRCKEVLDSWVGKFVFKEERRDGVTLIEPGLRPPQVGALFGVLAHWKTGNDPCTVVMPTGTGKTETMVALLVRERLPKLLVVVPTDALREQIAGKFLTLGLLKHFGVVGSDAKLPVVGTLLHRPKNAAEVTEYFARCNVVVTTMSVASGCTDKVQAAMAKAASHLFIDEAHHIGAPTWAKFRKAFKEKPIVQFTATPFRGDGKNIDGKAVFIYPVRKAQQDGYFRPVRFVGLAEYLDERVDESIAAVALTQLRADLAAGHNHIVMARVGGIQEAGEVVDLYRWLGREFQPVVVHSKHSREEKDAALRQLRSGKSRVLVCVDMFGEGFDMPELKIAAMHQIHKSLAITLQFTGRFTRSRSDIGDATLIANIAEAEVEESLADLYAVGANWNSLLQELSSGATTAHSAKNTFLAEFDDIPSEVPIQNVAPKMSTTVFRTKCRKWKPDRLTKAVKESNLYTQPSVNSKHKVLFFVTKETEEVPWGNIRGLRNTSYDLYLVHWDDEQSLLFIHSSNKDSMHEPLAKAIAGEDAELIRGEQMFRIFHNVKRLMPMNLGLRHVVEQSVRFSMHVGGDVAEGLSQAHLQNKTKSNMFGRGFEEGQKATYGCSYRGRVWSYLVASDIGQWVDWCHHIGTKLLDNSISVAEVLKGVMLPETATERPAKVPLLFEWHHEFFERGEDVVKLECAGHSSLLLNTELVVAEYNETGPLKFSVNCDGWSAPYEAVLSDGGVEYRPTGKFAVTMTVGRRSALLSEMFRTYPPTIRFVDGSFLEYNQYFVPRTGDRQPFNPARIDAWDWTGINPRRESQTHLKYTDSIQYRVIQTILRPEHDPSYDIVFDDDDKGEVADIVAMAVAGDRLLVHLFHCKYAKTTGRTQVKDLYEVCGQVQKSVSWRGDVDRLFEHLRDREAGRLAKGRATRFERGDLSRLMELRRRAYQLLPQFRMFIVQPGVSKSHVTEPQQDLLATTELYLQETYRVPLSIIASA